MNIKWKIILIGSLNFIIIIIATILIFNVSYFGYIDKEKEKSMIRNFEAIDYMIEKEEGNLQSLLVDWGQWDSTYEFMDDLNQEYMESNLSEATIKGLNLENVIYVNDNKKMISYAGGNVKKEDSQAILDKLLINNENFNKTNTQRTGLLFLKGEFYMVGTLPITSTGKDVESNGTIIMTRKIDVELLNYIERIIPVDLFFRETEQEKFERENERTYINLDNGIIAYNKENYQADKSVKDINEQDSITIKIVDNSYSNMQITQFFKNFIFEFLLVIVIIIIFDIIVVNRYVLKKILMFTNFMKRISETKDTKLSINIPGGDEFSKLADSTNEMISTLDAANEEILFLSYRDKLTSLRNRAYMEKMLSQTNENMQKMLGETNENMQKMLSETNKNIKSNYYIIMGDINGLKITNDALGHGEGDKLLKIVSDILKDNCDKDDIISRWGGDEFVVLIKDKDEIYVSKLIDKIKKECENEAKFNLKISVAWGYAEAYEEDYNTEAVMSLAEKRMYRNKLLDQKSVRGSTIKSLLRTLHEKNSETEEHTMRIKDLSMKLGKRLGLAKDKLDELELLSSLHDIGKIGIPEHILMKPSKLTDEEWEIIKTHSDIGYRIASSNPELAHIANKILAHHEKYDGTGYPNNLKGEEIPLLSRLINVVDSYDVMTHKRVYKDAFDDKYAIDELKRCSGTQFDPYIVKEFLDLLEEKKV